MASWGHCQASMADECSRLGAWLARQFRFFEKCAQLLQQLQQASHAEDQQQRSTQGTAKNGIPSPKQEGVHHAASQHPQSEISAQIASGFHFFRDRGDVLPAANIGPHMSIKAYKDLLAFRFS